MTVNDIDLVSGCQNKFLPVHASNWLLPCLKLFDSQGDFWNCITSITICIYIYSVQVLNTFQCSFVLLQIMVLTCTDTAHESPEPRLEPTTLGLIVRPSTSCGSRTGSINNLFDDEE